MSNGIKQGAVLSPVLFTVYIDGLFQRLQTSGIVCHIGGVFASAFGYADDIVSLIPSVYALRHLICTCEKISEDYNIIFNTGNSKLIYTHI